MLRPPSSVTLIAVVCVQLFALSSGANAETIRCSAADVQCLIAAIAESNADPHNTTISLAGGTYVLTVVNNLANGPNGLPSITSPVTIAAGRDGATLARDAGAPPFRILHVGPSGRLTLNGITVTGGAVPDFPDDFIAESGGAILNAGGAVTVIDGVLDGNSAYGGGAVLIDHGSAVFQDTTFTNNSATAGAAIANVAGTVQTIQTRFDSNRTLATGSVWSQNATTYISQSRFDNNISRTPVAGLEISGGTASITESTFKGNVSDDAGAIRVDQHATVLVRDSAFVENYGRRGGAAMWNIGGTVTVINTTFARNIAGPLPYVGGTVKNNGVMTILNSTLSGNTGAGSHAAPSDSTIASLFGTTTLQNTILVRGGGITPLLCDGTVVSSLGNNVIEDLSSCNVSIQLSDRIGTGGLGNLLDDATPGNAHFPLQRDSEAMNAANAAACPKKDQLGRPRSAHCDIGAVEFVNGPSH